MEIKILCPCGTKFKFDIEPINSRMPAPVNCPGCGADRTAQANEMIKAALAAAPPQPVPVAAPLPVAAPVAAAPAPPGLRLNRAPVAAAEPAAGGAPVPLPPTPVPMRPVPAQAGSKSKNPAMKVLTLVLTVAVIGLGAWRFGSRWYKRVNFFAQVASALSQAGSGDDSSDGGAKNLWYDDCAMLFVKHTNHLEVAQACKDYWKTQLHKNLTLIDAAEESMSPGEYELIAAHNGYVRIIGGHDWPEAQHEALAQQLSQQFGTLVFEWRSEHVADTYHFGVYDQGTRKFHAQMDIKGNSADEVVTTEGNDFAIANGYKPGKEGFKEFDVLDADKITQRLGMRLWDEKEGTDVKAVLLKESGPAGGG